MIEALSELKHSLLPILSNIWNAFINSFCKVEFLCFNNEPNWLGYIALFFFFLILLGIIIAIFER